MRLNSCSDVCLSRNWGKSCGSNLGRNLHINRGTSMQKLVGRALHSSRSYRQFGFLTLRDPQDWTHIVQDRIVE